MQCLRKSQGTHAQFLQLVGQNFARMYRCACHGLVCPDSFLSCENTILDGVRPVSGTRPPQDTAFQQGRVQARTSMVLLKSMRRFYREVRRDRKSTRLNSSHLVISYAVFCLKKKTET